MLMKMKERMSCFTKTKKQNVSKKIKDTHTSKDSQKLNKSKEEETSKVEKERKKAERELMKQEREAKMLAARERSKTILESMKQKGLFEEGHDTPAIDIGIIFICVMVIFGEIEHKRQLIIGEIL